MAKDIESIVSKQISRLSGATESITSGINGVTVAPGKTAAANKERYRAGIEANIDKWADNVSAVTLEDWKQAAIQKGVPRIAEGIRQAENKLRDFHTKLQNYQQSYLSKLNAKPVLSLEDGIAKASENIRMMAKFRYRR